MKFEMTLSGVCLFWRTCDFKVDFRLDYSSYGGAVVDVSISKAIDIEFDYELILV